MKPFSESCQRNQTPIFAILCEVFANTRCVLEIGSGTGQHAVYFGKALPHLIWQTSDLPDNHAGILAWLNEAALINVKSPLALNVEDGVWPLATVDGIFSANTAHIISWPQVTAMFAGIGRVLAPGGIACLYGPFNFAGTYTAESNARFDVWLKARDPLSGIRDFEAVDALARAQGLVLQHDYAMPANNRMLVWQRIPA